MGQPQAANDYLQFIQMIKPHMKHKRGVTGGLCVGVRFPYSSDKFFLENISKPSQKNQHIIISICVVL